MEFFENLKENILDFFHSNTKLAITVIAILVFLFTSGLIVLLSQVSKQTPKTKKTFVTKEEFFAPTDSFFPIEQDALVESYYFSLNLDDNHFEDFFTSPSEETITQLSSANDLLVESIIEAAP